MYKTSLAKRKTHSSWAAGDIKRIIRGTLYSHFCFPAWFMSWLESLWEDTWNLVDSNKPLHLQVACHWSWENTVCQIHCHWTVMGPHLASYLHNRSGAEEISLTSADTTLNYCKCPHLLDIQWRQFLPEMQTGKVETVSSGCHIWHLRLENWKKNPDMINSVTRGFSRR